MNVRPLPATVRRASAVGTTVLVVSFIEVGGQTIARAQGGRAANQPPVQGIGTSKNLIPNGMPQGAYPPYPVKDPTAGERAGSIGQSWTSGPSGP